jgi:hypothetical protein
MNPRSRLFSCHLLLTVFLTGMFLMMAPAALAQTTALTVQVKDSDGKPVAGATVKAVNRTTRQIVTGVTSDNGIAVLIVPAGKYDVTVESAGYEKSVRKNLQITVTESKVETMTLKAAVAPPPPPLQPPVREEANQAASSLPNQNNDLTPALDVVIGTVTTGATSLGRVVVDGKGADQQTTRLDGVDFNLLTEMPSSDPTIDALGSFTSPQVGIDLDKVSTKRGPFEARYGPGTGAVSEISSFNSTEPVRPKRNWVVEMFGQLRNDKFNARNYFDYEERNGLRSGRFAAKAGRGLDDRERTWVFVGYEGARARTERNVYEAVPVDARGCCAVGPLAQFLQGYLPTGTTVKEDSTNNNDFLLARRRVKTTVNANAFNGRFEYLPFIGSDFKAANTLAVRYTRQGVENLVPDGVTGRKQRQNILFNNLMTSYYFKSSDSTSHTIWFGLNQTRARVNVETLAETNPSLAESMISLSGNVSPVGVIGLPPTIPVATLGGLVKGVGRGFRHENLSTSLAYSIEHKFVDHTLLGGIEGRLLRLGVDRLGGLTYSFPNRAAWQAGTPNQITFLSDLSGPAPFSIGNGTRHPQQNYLLGYIQMQSRFGKPAEDPTNGKTQAPFSVTYGLRYDYFGVVRERDNRAAVFDPNTGAFLPGAAFYKADKLNLQPRVSLAWRLGANGTKLERTVFRFGAGVYSGVPRPGDFLLPIDSDRFSTGIRGGVFPISPNVIINNFLNSDSREYQPLAFSRDFVGIERLYKWEGRLIQNWRGYDFSILYTGNVGRNLPLARLANKIVSVTTNVDPTKDTIVVREFDTERNGKPVKPFGEFFFRTSEGHSSYNAVTLSFGRNADATLDHESGWLHTAVRGLGIQYTLSRNVGNASGTLLSNPFDAEGDFGHNAAHPRHNFRITSVYDLWKGPTKNPDHLLWGWRLSSLLRINSGIPFVVRLTRPDVVYVDSAGKVFSGPGVGRTAVINTPGGGATGDSRVPNLLPGANPYLKNGLQFLDPAAFAIPAPGEFGNLKRGALRGPSVAQLDLSLRKNLYDGESKEQNPFSMQFQIDIFNVFNHANFALPVSTLRDALGTNNDQLQPGVAFTQTAARNFGVLNSADPGRVIQFSLTLRLKNGFTAYKASK